MSPFPVTAINTPNRSKLEWGDGYEGRVGGGERWKEQGTGKGEQFTSNYIPILKKEVDLCISILVNFQTHTEIEHVTPHQAAGLC